MTTRSSLALVNSTALEAVVDARRAAAALRLQVERHSSFFVPNARFDCFVRRRSAGGVALRCEAQVASLFFAHRFCV